MAKLKRANRYINGPTWLANEKDKIKFFMCARSNLSKSWKFLEKAAKENKGKAIILMLIKHICEAETKMEKKKSIWSKQTKARKSILNLFMTRKTKVGKHQKTSIDFYLRAKDGCSASRDHLKTIKGWSEKIMKIHPYWGKPKLPNHPNWRKAILNQDRIVTKKRIEEKLLQSIGVYDEAAKKLFLKEECSNTDSQLNLYFTSGYSPVATNPQ